MEGSLQDLGLATDDAFSFLKQADGMGMSSNPFAGTSSEPNPLAALTSSEPDPFAPAPDTQPNAIEAPQKAVVPAPAPSVSEPQAEPASEVDRSLHPSGIVPILQNVVATVTLGVKLDLKNIALKARNAEYNPKRFAAVIMRIREPKTTALIFASGKMVCTGAKSEDASRLAARKYCRILQKLDYKAEFKEFKIQNIVGSCDVQFPIRLEGLSWSHQMFCNYEPELFPGLIYRMKQPKIVLLIFVSGKVVLTGAKHRNEIYQAFEQLYPVLREFRKADVAPPAEQGAGRPLLALPPSDGAVKAEDRQ